MPVFLRERGLTRLFFAGLAFDFCVGFSALDGTALGFECIMLEDLTRPVNLPGFIAQPGSVAQPGSIARPGSIAQLGSVAQMRTRLTQAGVRCLPSAELA